MLGVTESGVTESGILGIFYFLNIFFGTLVFMILLLSYFLLYGPWSIFTYFKQDTTRIFGLHQALKSKQALTSAVFFGAGHNSTY